MTHGCRQEIEIILPHYLQLIAVGGVYELYPSDFERKAPHVEDWAFASHRRWVWYRVHAQNLTRYSVGGFDQGVDDCERSEQF